MKNKSDILAGILNRACDFLLVVVERDPQNELRDEIYALVDDAQKAIKKPAKKVPRVRPSAIHYASPSVGGTGFRPLCGVRIENPLKEMATIDPAAVTCMRCRTAHNFPSQKEKVNESV